MKASKDQERAAEVDEAFRDRWAIFLRPEHQLVPFVERRDLKKKKKRDRDSDAKSPKGAAADAPSDKKKKKKEAKK